MTAPTLLLILFACLILRIGFVALHVNRIESLWYDFERRGFLFRLAQSIDLATFLGYVACAVYALWMLRVQGDALGRFGTAFVAWTGILLLERLAVHSLPRTNSPQLYSDAKVSLFTNLLLAVAGGLVLTGVSTLYDWLRR